MDKEIRTQRIALVMEKGLQKAFRGVAVGYGFDLRMTDKDSSSAGVDFGLPFSKSALALGISLSEEKTRSNTRQFELAEDVTHLLADAGSCEPQGANWRYPLAGEIGLVATVGTYANLAEVGGFFKERKKSADKEGGSVAETEFTDTLEFTTELVGGVTSALSFSSVPKEFRLVKMSPKVTGTRKDVHKLTVTFAKGDDKKEDKDDEFPVVRRATDKALDVLKAKRLSGELATEITRQLGTQ